jgi:hypothetical protein
MGRNEWRPIPADVSVETINIGAAGQKPPPDGRAGTSQVGSMLMGRRWSASHHLN